MKSYFLVHFDLPGLEPAVGPVCMYAVGQHGPDSTETEQSSAVGFAWVAAGSWALCTGLQLEQRSMDLSLNATIDCSLNILAINLEIRFVLEFLQTECSLHIRCCSFRPRSTSRSVFGAWQTAPHLFAAQNYEFTKIQNTFLYISSLPFPWGSFVNALTSSAHLLGDNIPRLFSVDSKP